MRCVVALILLSACTTETEDERLTNLLEGARACARSHNNCFPDPEDAIACMNGALTSDERAYTYETRQDTYGFYVDTYHVAVDGKILVFERQNGDNWSNETTARRLATCEGPYYLGTACHQFAEGIGMFDGSSLGHGSCDEQSQ